MLQIHLCSLVKNKCSVALVLAFTLVVSSTNAQVLQWSTYLNTTGTEEFSAAEKDNAGDIYVLGRTNANGFPVSAGAFQNNIGTASRKLTITKLSGVTGALLWSTYLGGNNDEMHPYRLYWDAGSNTINVAASTKSASYPISGGGNPRVPGTTFARVLTQFNASNGNIIYSTHIFNVFALNGGGSGFECRAEFANGFAYFLSYDTAYKKLLVSKIDLAAHQFVYQKSIKTTTGVFNHTIGTFGMGFIIDNGEVYLTGGTTATDLPTTAGAYQTRYPTGAPEAYFIVKLDALGNTGFATYANECSQNILLSQSAMAVGNNDVALGGTFTDGIAVSPTGIPFDNIEPTNLGVLKLNKTNGSLQYFSYLGACSDYFLPVKGLRYAGDDLLIVGNSDNGYLPVTPNAIQPFNSYHQPDGQYAGDCYIMHISPANQLVYCSYLGGTGSDQLYNYNMINYSGSDVYFLGITNSTNFPTTPNATQPVNKGTYNNGQGELVLVKYNIASRAVTYSSYLGTNVNENIYYSSNSYSNVPNTGTLLIGATSSHDAAHPLTNDFPISPDAFQKTMIGGNNAASHQYVAEINTVTGKLNYGSYIGSLPSGGGELGLSLIPSGNDVFLSGISNSNDYPVTAGAPRSSYLGNTDLFVTKLSLCHTPVVEDTLTPKTISICANALVPVISGSVPKLDSVNTVLRNGVVQPSQRTLTNFTYQWQQSTDSLSWTFINGATERDYQPVPTAVKKYFRRIAKPAFCDNADTSDVTTVSISNNTAVQPNAGGTGNFFTCPGNNFTLGTAAVGGVTYSWLPADHLTGAGTAQAVFNNNTSGAYTYVLYATSANGCTAMDTATIYNYAASAGPDKFICQGKPIQIGGTPLAGLAGVTYNWSPVTGLSCSNCSQPVASSPGTYIVTVTVPLPSGGNCVTKDTVIIGTTGINPDPAGPDQTVCNGSPATIGTPRVAGYVYNWTPGMFLSGIADVDQPVFNALNATLYPMYNPISYLLTAANPAGCTVTDTVKIYVVNPFAGQTGCRPLQIGMRDRTRGQASYEWVEVLAGNTEVPVGPGELSSTTISNPVALYNTAITTPKTYRLKMTWNGVTCSSDVTVGIVCLPFCSPLDFKSKSGCPTVSANDSVTLYVQVPNPDYSYSWSPSTGLNTTTGPEVITGVTTSTTYTCTARSRLDNSIQCEVDIKVNLFNTSAPVFAAPDTTICKNTTANIGLAPVAGLNYSWTSSQSGGSILYTSANPQIQPTEDIAYYVEVNDQVTGCHAFDTINVHVPVVTADAGPSRPSCTGGGFTLGTPAVPGLVYNWQPAAGLDNAGIAQPTVIANDSDIVYVLRVTDPVSGCSQFGFTFIQHTNTPVLGLINPPLPYCEGSNASVQIGNTALSGVTYSWSPSTNLSDPAIAQPVANPSITTIYTVTATFSGACATSAAQNVTVTVIPKPSVTASVTNNCDNSQLDIITNAVNANYYWSPFYQLNSPYISNPVSTTNIPITYTVNVNDIATGCNNSASIDVTPPIAVDAGADREFCPGGTATIGTPPVSGVSYSWSPATGLSNSNIAQPALMNNLAPGVYTYTVTATGSACTKTDDVVVKVNVPPSVNMTPGVTICKNASVQIGASPETGVSYSWTPAAGLSDASIANPVASPLQTTVYSLVATNIVTGCTAAAGTTVTVNETGAPVVNAANPASICPGATVQLNANVAGAGSYTYVWTPDINFVTSRFISNPVVAPPVTTNYQVLVTNTANGCANTAEVIVRVDTCSVTPVNWLSFTAVLQNGKTMLNWSVAMEENNKEFIVERSMDGVHWAPLFTVPGLGNTSLRRNYHGLDAAPKNGINFYRVKQVDVDGRASWSVIRNVRLGSGGIEFIVYPNPAHDVLNYELVNGGNAVNMDLLLFAADGRLISKRHVTSNRGSFSVYNLPAGIYVLTMADQTGKMENKKVIVQK